VNQHRQPPPTANAISRALNSILDFSVQVLVAWIGA
jgi:hypothetical protein